MYKHILCNKLILLWHFFTVHTCVGDVSETMPVKVKHLQSEVSGCCSKIQSLSLKLTEQDRDICGLREELRKLFDELAETRVAIMDIADELNKIPHRL